MAVYYVWSGAGGAGTGADWTNAYTTLAAADAVAGPGDSIKVHYTHSETDVAIVIGTADTAARDDPFMVVSVDKDNSDTPTAGASFSGRTTLSIGTTSDCGAFFWGCVFICSATSAGDLVLSADSNLSFEQCEFQFGANASAASELQGNNDGMKRFINCTINSTTSTGPTFWNYNSNPGATVGLAIKSGSAALTTFMESHPGQFSAFYDNLDLSAGASTLSFVGAGPNAVQGAAFISLANSKVPASFAFPGFTIADPGTRCEAWNVTSGSHLHGIIVAKYAGTITDNTTTYLRGDVNGTGFSLEFATSTNSTTSALEMRLFEAWLGANPTITVNFTSDTALDAGMAWLLIEYPDSTTPALAKVVSTRDIAYMAGDTPAALTTNSESWTSGKTNKYEISYTVSGGAAGPHRVTFFLVDVGTTGFEVYVDPEPEIS